MEDVSKIKGRALKTVDEAAARKKREQNVTHLCRSRKDENLAKKRHVGQEETETAVESAGPAATPLSGPAKLGNLHEYVRGECLLPCVHVCATRNRAWRRELGRAWRAVAHFR